MLDDIIELKILFDYIDKISIESKYEYDKIIVMNWVLSKFTEEELIDFDNEVFKQTKVLLEEKF